MRPVRASRDIRLGDATTGQMSTTTCPAPVLRSSLTKIETEILNGYFANLVWKKIIFSKSLSSEIDHVKHEEGHLCCG